MHSSLAWMDPFLVRSQDLIRSQGFLRLKTNLGTRFAQAVQTQGLSPLQGLSLLALQAHFFFLITPLRRLKLWRIWDWRAKTKNLPVCVTVFNSILTWNANSRASSQEHKEFLIILCCYRQEGSGIRTNQMSSVLLETLLSKGTDIKSLFQ